MKVLGKISRVIQIILQAAGRTVTIEPDNGATNDITVHVPDEATTATMVLDTTTQSLTNKTIDADQNTLTNIEDADIKAGANIDAAKLGTGVVDNADFNKLDTRGTDAADELATTDAAQTFTNKTLTSPTVNTPDIDGGTVDGATIDQINFTTTGVAQPYTVTVPYDVTLTTDGPVAFSVVTTEAELTAALLLGGTIGVNADITLTGQAVLSVADTELVCLNKKYSLTAASSATAPLAITANGCVIRNVQLITSSNISQNGVDLGTADKCQVADCTVTMDNLSTASAVYSDGSYNRITDLLADSAGGGITGVTLDTNATDNLVSGVIVV